MYTPYPPWNRDPLLIPALYDDAVSYLEKIQWLRRRIDELQNSKLDKIEFDNFKNWVISELDEFNEEQKQILKILLAGMPIVVFNWQEPDHDVYIDLPSACYVGISTMLQLSNKNDSFKPSENGKTFIAIFETLNPNPDSSNPYPLLVDAVYDNCNRFVSGEILPGYRSVSDGWRYLTFGYSWNFNATVGKPYQLICNNYIDAASQQPVKYYDFADYKLLQQNDFEPFWFLSPSNYGHYYMVNKQGKFMAEPYFYQANSSDGISYQVNSAFFDDLQIGQSVRLRASLTSTGAAQIRFNSNVFRPMQIITPDGKMTTGASDVPDYIQKDITFTLVRDGDTCHILDVEAVSAGGTDPEPPIYIPEIYKIGVFGNVGDEIRQYMGDNNGIRYAMSFLTLTVDRQQGRMWMAGNNDGVNGGSEILSKYVYDQNALRTNYIQDSGNLINASTYDYETNAYAPYQWVPDNDEARSNWSGTFEEGGLIEPFPFAFSIPANNIQTIWSPFGSTTVADQVEKSGGATFVCDVNNNLSIENVSAPEGLETTHGLRFLLFMQNSEVVAS